MRIDLEDPTPDQVAEVVRRLLDGQNKTSMANTVGVSRETIYRWERGDSEPSLAELTQLARCAEGEVVITLNRQRPSLEDQIEHLRKQMEERHSRQGLAKELLELLAEQDDPRVREILRRLREN